MRGSVCVTVGGTIAQFGHECRVVIDTASEENRTYEGLI